MTSDGQVESTAMAADTGTVPLLYFVMCLILYR